MTIIEHKFEHPEAMLAALYQQVVEDLARALQERGTATLLLSGGSTPAPLYRRLSQASLDWAQVQIALVDERWVEAGNLASNERLLRESMLINKAAQAKFTGMKNSAGSPFDGVMECNLRYADLTFPHTVCLLGMGPDGHTASLFPGAEGLDAALNSHQHCAPIRAIRSGVTGDLVERMTMTPWSILQSERLVLLITGEDKWEVLQQARQQSGEPALPIGHFIHQQTPALEVYWSP
jgi:6-phosphogluconolactonase